jgi:uncharacterized delta-60 repeat protein
MRALAMGSFPTLILGSLGCSGSPGGNEETGIESNALTSGSLNWTVSTTSLGGEGYTDVKIQPNGNLVAAGWILHTGANGMDLKVARVLPTGHWDTTFAKGGVFSYEIGNNGSTANSTATLSNGNILVVGQTTVSSQNKAFILQLNSAGQLATSFGTGGFLQLNIGCCDDSANDIVVQPDGKFLIAGYTNVKVAGKGPTSYPMIVRLLPTGAFDTSFGQNGIAKGPIEYNAGLISRNTFYRLILQPNGSIIGVGSGGDSTSPPPAESATLVDRFTSAGVLDTTFGTGGKILDDYHTGVAEYKQAQLLSNGNIVTAGYIFPTVAPNPTTTYQTVVAQYSSAGKLVTTFGSGGKVIFPSGATNYQSHGQSVAIQADGKILVGGTTDNTMSGQPGGAIARLNPNGSFDTTFASAGTKHLSAMINSLALQSNGTIFGAGELATGKTPPAPVGDSVLYSLNP